MKFMNATLGQKTRKNKQTSPASGSITVDYPQENERISATNYTFRISTGAELQNIEVSINGGSWQGCRASSGHWWHDWQVDQSGPHILLVRGQTQTGEKVISGRRQFTVKF